MGLHPLGEAGYFSRFLVALGLGVLIGIEREWRQRNAGLHTMAMVAAGAAIFAMIAPLIEVKGVDPTRIAAQVVSGVGFLAGGVILRQGSNVVGLTTAATIWATSAIGVLVGFGLMLEATGAAVAVVLANVILYPLSHVVDSVKRNTVDVVTTYTVQMTCTTEEEAGVREFIVDFVSSGTFTLAAIQSAPADQRDVSLQIQLSRVGRDDRAIERLVNQLKMTPGVSGVQWKASGEFL